MQSVYRGLLGGSLLSPYAWTVVCFGIPLVFLHLTREIWFVLMVCKCFSVTHRYGVFVDVMVAF